MEGDYSEGLKGGHALGRSDRCTRFRLGTFRWALRVSTVRSVRCGLVLPTFGFILRLKTCNTKKINKIKIKIKITTPLADLDF